MKTGYLRHHLITLFVAILCVTLEGRVVVAKSNATNMCAVNSGLNPACPLTATGVSLRSTTLNATATQTNLNFSLERALHGRTQVLILLPAYNALTITHVGSAHGVGDLSIGLSHVFLAHHGYLMNTIGGMISAPTGANAFSAGRVTLDPFYALSYAPLRNVQLVFTLDYAFGVGGTRLPFAPRVQILQFAPRAIIDLGQQFFISGSATQARVSGDYRYTSYVANATAGFVGHHASLSLSYSAPLGLYSRNITFYHAVTLNLTMRP